MGFFGVPLSGLLAGQAQLQAVSNNLANLDTVGFKGQTASFSDLFAQSSLLDGAGNPIESGLGVATSGTSTDFTDVAPSTTGVASNMALSGDGFFVTQTADGAQNYTRAGNFTPNSQGQLTTAAGELVLGYPAVNGVVSTSSPLQPLQIGLGSSIAATPTTEFSMPANLNSAAAPGSNFPGTIAVYDSLGTTHELTVTYTKSTTAANSWNYSVDVPTADTGAASTQVASGSLTFDSSGILTSPTGSVAVSIPTLTDGAAPLNLQWNLHDGSGNPVLTQTNAASAVSGEEQDGRASGTLTNFSVRADGTIEGSYSNGQTSALGQVAVATFYNEQGLARAGNNDYIASSGSGAASIGVAGTGGRGTITGGSIENSNVNVAAEFAKMIVAQQAYQANAKTITTLDQISQTIMQMIS